MAKKSLSKRIRSIIFVVLILLGIFVYFNKRTSITVLVRSVKIENREVRKTVSASGVVKSSNQADLSFSATGDVIRLNVKENDTVKKGQLLAYMDSSSLNKTIQSYKDARDIRIRQKDLFVEEKDANETLLGGEDSYKIKLREYDESISQAEAVYQAQLAMLSNYSIYSPIDGTVMAVNYKEGEVAIAGSPAITVANLDDIVFEVVLDQEDYGSIHEGQDVEIELDAYDSDVFNGKVTSLPLYADTTRGGFVVKSNFESNGKSARVGMTGDAFMITAKTQESVPSLVFNQISYDESDNPFVWIVEDNKVKKYPIEIGLEGDIYVEVKTDLSGKNIVVPATENLDIKEGFIAKVIN